LYALLGAASLGAAVAFGYRSLTGVVDRLNRRYEADLRDRMDRVGMDTADLTLWMRGRVVGAVVVGLFLAVGLQMLPVGILAGVATFVLVPALLERRLGSHRNELRDQLVTAVRNLAGQIRGKAILVRGLARVAEQTPDPLGRLLRGCTHQIARGVRVDVALTELKDRVRMDYLSLLLLTLAVGYEKKEGESLADLLDGIAHSLAENQRVDRKRESDTAAGRLLVNLLACFPIAFLVLFGFLDPEATTMVFSTVAGQVVLCLVGGLTWFSVWLARRILGQVV
jgi:Flp pilus assembly protein TadB